MDFNESTPYQHPYMEYINPYVGKMLSQIGLDRVFTQGEGCYLYDEQGNRYLDFLAQYGSVPFGYNHPRIWDAVIKLRNSQLPCFVQPSFPLAASELARVLVRITPAGLNKVTFANSGAEAVEAAIKLCRAATKRKRLLSAYNGFHGKTMGALSATPKKEYQEGFFLPKEQFSHIEFGNIEALEKALATKEFAAFIVEPIQGEGGVIVPPEGYLKQVQSICNKTQTLLVVDEIQTGLGRTGEMFVCESEGITPDVMLLAKSLSGGLVPIGVCLCTDEVYTEKFANKHTSTFAGNALACRVALETVEMLVDPSLSIVSQVKENGQYLIEGLQKIKQKYPTIISEVRGKGYMLGLKFSPTFDSGVSNFLLRAADTDILTGLVMSHLLNREKIRVAYTLNDGGVLRIQPPLIATRTECDIFLKGLDSSIEQLVSGSMARYSAHLAGADFQSIPKRLNRKNYLKYDKQEKDACFAFLLHPLTVKDYENIDDSFNDFSDIQISRLSECISDNFSPFVIGDVRIDGGDGRSAFGEFIVIPQTADSLASAGYQASKEIITEALDLAKRRGAKIVGLGAHTSIVTAGGLSLLGGDIPAITTGNSFTVATSLQAIVITLQRQHRLLEDCTICIVGASGAIGRAMALSLSKKAGRVVLIGNPKREKQSLIKLKSISHEIVSDIVGTYKNDNNKNSELKNIYSAVVGIIKESIDKNCNEKDFVDLVSNKLIEIQERFVLTVDRDTYLSKADIIICATSSTENLFDKNTLKTNAIICDISRPMNIDKDQLLGREDITLIEGGIVKLPSGILLGFNSGLKDNYSYSCIAETALLALDNRYENISLGAKLKMGEIEYMDKLGKKYGFNVVV